MLLQIEKSFLAAQTDAWLCQAKLAVRNSFLYLLELKKVLLKSEAILYSRAHGDEKTETTFFVFEGVVRPLIKRSGAGEKSFLAAQTDAWLCQAKLAVRNSFLYLQCLSRRKQ